MKYLKILYRLLVYLTSLSVCSRDIKNALKMISKLVIFRAFFVSPTLNLKKNPVNQLITNSGYDKNGRKMSQPQTADYPSTSKGSHSWV